MMDLRRLFGSRAASAPVARERFEFCSRMSAVYAASPTCWHCCGRRSWPWCPVTSCSTRTRLSSGWSGARPSRRSKSISRCPTISNDREPWLPHDRRQQQQHRLAPGSAQEQPRPAEGAGNRALHDRRDRELEGAVPKSPRRPAAKDRGIRAMHRQPTSGEPSAPSPTDLRSLASVSWSSWNTRGVGQR